MRSKRTGPRRFCPMASWDDGPNEPRKWVAVLDSWLYRFVTWIERKARG